MASKKRRNEDAINFNEQIGETLEENNRYFFELGAFYHRAQEMVSDFGGDINQYLKVFKDRGKEVNEKAKLDVF